MNLMRTFVYCAVDVVEASQRKLAADDRLSSAVESIQLGVNDGMEVVQSMTEITQQLAALLKLPDAAGAGVSLILGSRLPLRPHMTMVMSHLPMTAAYCCTSLQLTRNHRLGLVARAHSSSRTSRLQHVTGPTQHLSGQTICFPLDCCCCILFALFGVAIFWFVKTSTAKSSALGWDEHMRIIWHD